MKNLIEIKGVRHAYRTDAGPLPVLDGLEIAVPEGGFVAVVGPSGCGKSTLTRLIAGLMKPDHGEVWLHGERVKGPRSTVGMAFQNPVLLEWRSILKNVLLPLEIVPSKLSKREAEDRARFLLSLVGLEGFEDKRPSELSGGMRQRASLCRALIHQPEVLILDEPFGALDAFTREDLWQTMHKVKEREPFTGVLITHDLRESIFLADQVVVLSGRPRAHAICAGYSAQSHTNAGRSLYPRSRRTVEYPAPPDSGRPRPHHGRCRMNKHVQAFAVPLIAVVVFLAFWEWLVWVNGWPTFKMAAPSDLPAAYIRHWDLFLTMGWQTLWRTILGLLLAVIFGTFLGMIMGFSRIMRDALYPLLVGFNAIPKATVVPIVALMFVGQHDFNTVLLAFIISFFPIAVSVSIGLSTLEPEYRDILRSLGASQATIFWKIALPKNPARILRCVESCGHTGLHRHQPDGNRQPAWARLGGALFDSGRTNSDFPLMFAVLIALAFLGIVLYYIVVALEKIFAGWAERAPG